MPISTATMSPTAAPAWAGIQTKYDARVRDIAWDALGFTLDSTNKEPLGLVPIQLQPATNNSTRPALKLNQDNDTISLSIDSEQTTTNIVDIEPTVLTTGWAISADDGDALTTGGLLQLVSNSSATATRSLVYVKNDHASATAVTVAELVQDSTKDGLFIDHNGATGKALYIDSENTTHTSGIIDISPAVLTSGTVIDIGDADALTTGYIAYFVSNSSATATRSLVYAKNDHASATAATVAEFVQDSTANSVFIDHNGATGKALYIDSENTTHTSGIVDISAAALTSGTAININDANVLTTGKLINLETVSTDTGAFILINAAQNSATATGSTVFQATQASTGSVVTLKNTNAGATGAVIDFQHDSASPADNDVIVRIRFIGDDANGTAETGTTLDCIVSTAASGDYSTKFGFYTMQNDAQNEAMRILSTGQIQVDVASAIAGTTGTADVFDEHDDVAVLSQWNLDPQSRLRFMESLEAIGQQTGTKIVERKDTGSGWMMNLQSMQFLTVGAVNQLNRKLESAVAQFGERLQLLERALTKEPAIVDV